GICGCCCATAAPEPATAAPSTPRSTIAVRRAFVFRLIISNPVLPQFQPARPRMVAHCLLNAATARLNGRLQCLWWQIQCSFESNPAGCSVSHKTLALNPHWGEPPVRIVSTKEFLHAPSQPTVIDHFSG